MHKGLLSDLSRTRTWGAVKHWMAGRGRFPAWAARDLANVLENRARGDLALAEELRRHADVEDARLRRVSGFGRVPDE